MSKIDNKKLKPLKNTNKSKYNQNILNTIKKIMNKIKLKFNSMKKTVVDIRNKKVTNSKKQKKNKKDFNFDYKTLTKEQIEECLKRETYKSKYFNILTSTIYSLIIIAAIALIVATLIMPVFQISGSAMAPKLNNGDFVVSIKTSNVNSGDIIAFYHGNKILVKRVIARAGQWVVIDEEGNVYVDGILLQETYIDEKMLGDYDIKFPYQVPDGSWFVLSDNRSNVLDSRNSEIGCIKEEDIIGKILFKVWDSNK